MKKIFINVEIKKGLYLLILYSSQVYIMTLLHLFYHLQCLFNK